MESFYPCTTELPDPQTTEKVKRLLADLQSSDRKRRKAAEAALYGMGDDAVRSIMALKHMGMRDQRTREYQRHALVLLCAAVGLICAGVALMLLQTGGWLDAAVPIALGPLLVWSTWRAATGSSTVTAPTRSELLLLLSIADRRSIPILMDLQSDLADAHQQWQIRKRIMELLPTLDAADARIIPHTYVDRLAKSIEGAWTWQDGCDVRFAVAVLEALKKIGTREGVRVVERLARHAQHEAIQLAACECLPHLLVSAERQQVSGTLLRATAGAEPHRELVRAAGAAEDDGASQLLRVADGEPLR